VGHYCDEALRWINGMDTQQWFYVLVCAIIVGLVCLKGFGSRSGY